MRAILLIFALSFAVAACDSVNGPPTNNPPPGPPADMSTGQSHTSCPFGQSIC